MPAKPDEDGRLVRGERDRELVLERDRTQARRAQLRRPPPFDEAGALEPRIEAWAL